jgi:hypothetical protein
MRKGFSMAAVLTVLVMGSSGSSWAEGWVPSTAPYLGHLGAEDGYGRWGPTMGCCGAGIDCHGYPPVPNYSPICCFGYNPPSNYSPISWIVPPAENMHLVRLRLAGMGIHPTPLHHPSREVAPPPEGDKLKKKVEPGPKKDDVPRAKQSEDASPGRLYAIPLKKVGEDSIATKPQSLPPPEK